VRRRSSIQKDFWRLITYPLVVFLKSHGRTSQKWDRHASNIESAICWKPLDAIIALRKSASQSRCSESAFQAAWDCSSRSCLKAVVSVHLWINTVVVGLASHSPTLRLVTPLLSQPMAIADYLSGWIILCQAGYLVRISESCCIEMLYVLFITGKYLH
jgi:hypothetical protein